MPKREPQVEKLKNKRVEDHMNVLRYLMDTKNLKQHGTGRLESPQKLIIFYAGYMAMRRIWEIQTNHGRDTSGDQEIDMDKDDKASIIYRIDKEIAHPLGLETNTLLRISKFKYWGKKFLNMRNAMR